MTVPSNVLAYLFGTTEPNELPMMSLRTIRPTLAIVQIFPKSCSTAADSCGWATHLYERCCLPYITRAFFEDIEDLSEESRVQHRIHLISGDVLFVAVAVSCGDDGVELLHAVGHALFKTHSVSSGAGSSQLVFHCAGMCVDPNCQGGGVGMHLIDTAFAHAVGTYTDVDEIIASARTQNDAVLKIFVKCAQAQRPTAVVFPSCAASDERTALQQIAGAAVGEYYHDVPYDAQSGIFPKCYPPFLIKVFGGDKSRAVHTTHIPNHVLLASYMATEEGDGALIAAKIK